MRSKAVFPVRDLVDPLTIGYLAGLIDGEGHIGISTAFDKKTSRSLSYVGRLLIANTDARLMAWLNANVGGTCQVSERRTGPKTWKPRLVWSVTGQNCERVLRAVLPHLVLKRAQAETVLELRALQAAAGRRPATTEQQEQKAGLKARIHVLNARGIKAA